MLLNLSREQRFRDDRKDLLLDLLGLRPGFVVADLGCGPGALARKLAKWLGPSSKVLGVDRDKTFLQYARLKAKGLYEESHLSEGQKWKVPNPRNEPAIMVFDRCHRNVGIRAAACADETDVSRANRAI